MAGNPFRRPGAAGTTGTAPGVAGRDAAADLSVDTSDSVIKPKKVVKRVRIQSPVISPDEPIHDLDPFDARLNDEGHSGSPPPPDLADPEAEIATELRKSFIDSVARGASNLNAEAVGDVPVLEQALPEAASGTETIPTRIAPHQAPYNPFSKTLASIEGGYAVPASTSANYNAAPTSAEANTKEHTGQGNGKAAMDVDSFTRMLLTGKPVATTAPLGQPPLTPAPSTTVTNAGNSTLAPPTMLEPISYSASPRSSSEVSRADATAGVTEHTKDLQAKKAKPPPPAHHRGKLLSKKGPQVVSFADFDTSLMPDSGQQSSALPSPRLAGSDAARLSSDDIKALSSPPVPTGSQATAETAQSNPLDAPSQTPAHAPHQTLLQPVAGPQLAKSRPPPPPASRRGSQIRTDGPTGRARSGSNLSRSSIPDDYNETTISSLANSPVLQPTKPAPPPTRRGINSVASVDRDASVPRSIPEGLEPTSQPPPSSAKAPPPPPSRQALRGAPNLTRTPSTQSTSSIGHRRVSPSVHQVPPPPPPRRSDKRSSFDESHLSPSSRRPSDAGGSQRSSVELRRLSNASMNHARSPSISSLQNVPESGDRAGRGAAGDAAHDSSAVAADPALQGPEDPSNGGGKDILADLSAFQAEIDALRAQIGK